MVHFAQAFIQQLQADSKKTLHKGKNLLTVRRTNHTFKAWRFLAGTTNNNERGLIMNGFAEYYVYLAGQLYDVVYYAKGTASADVKRDLVTREGYNAKIKVVRG